MPASFFRGSNNEALTTTPKAYFIYLFFDEQLKYAGGNFSRVGTSGSVKDHWTTDQARLKNITAPKNGYIFVYVSNESNFDVFFDNLQVIHKPGPILEETNYYPFGLTMAGISSKAANTLTNKYKFGGKELQSNEFSDNSGLELYDFGARYNDVQTGRWNQIDPLAEKFLAWSPYTSMGDNPIRMKDPDGRRNVNFDQDGNYVNTTKDNWWHNFWNGSKGRVLNSEGKTDIKFNFSDPKNDVADIQSGKIKRIEFVKDGDIDNFMQKAGVFNSNKKSILGVGNVQYAIKQGHGKLDFSYNGIPEAYPEASRDPQNDQVPPTPMIFLVKNPMIKGGKYGTAYNHMNFGNFLTGAALEALGFPEASALVGAHVNSVFRDHNGLDSNDDQNAISDGWNYGMSRGYSYKTMKPKIIVGPLE